jgi:hypothetical protein
VNGPGIVENKKGERGTRYRGGYRRERAFLRHVAGVEAGAFGIAGVAGTGVNCAQLGCPGIMAVLRMCIRMMARHGGSQQGNSQEDVLQHVHTAYIDAKTVPLFKKKPPGLRGAVFEILNYGLDFEDGKIVLADTALGAFPVVGNIFKLGSRRNPAVGIADFRVVNPATYVTDIFFHN